MNIEEQYESARPLQSRINLHALYGQNKEPWHRWCFDRLALTCDLAVLEIGCGTGVLWFENRDRLEQLQRLVVSDASEAMVRETVSSIGRAVSNLESAVAPAEHLPFADAFFDLVIANHMLYHTKVERALAEMHRVLRPRGRLVASCNGPRHMRELDELLPLCGSSVQLDTTADVFGLATGPELLKPLFDDIRVERYPDELLITDAEHAINYLTSLYGEKAVKPAAACARQRVLQAIGSAAAFRVQKESGLISCRKR